MTYRNFTNASELLDQLRQLLADRYRQPAGAIISVAIQPGDEAILATGRVLFSDTKIQPRPLAEYERVFLVEMWVPYHGTLQALTGLLGGGWEIAGHPVPGKFRGANAHTVLCGTNDHAGWSEEVFDVSVQDKHASLLSQDAVVCAGLPAYRNVVAASESWVHGRAISRQTVGSDAGRLTITLPDTRARITRAELEADAVTITLEAQTNRDDLALQVASPTKLAISPADVLPVPPTVRFEVPAETEEITLFLINKPRELLAQVELSRVTPLFGEAPERLRTLRAAQVDLLAGESETIEFKPFCDLHSDKGAELLETVVAFANTCGGRLYIGIDRHGVPEGVQALRKYAEVKLRQSAPSAMLKDYKGRVGELICDKLKAVPDFDTRELSIEGAPVLVVDVLRGSKVPYSTHQHDVFIRKGSTNRKPDPRTELPGIKRPQLPF
jgi:hypothetical protein